MKKSRLFDVKPVEYRVFLRSREGVTFVYDSYREFLFYLNSYIIDRLGKRFNEILKDPPLHYQYSMPWYLWRRVDYVAEYRGNAIDPEMLIADWEEFRRETKKENTNNWLYRLRNRIYVYRVDPVPFTGCRSWHKGSYYRRIKTTQERRISFCSVDDGVRWRGKRNFRNLPNSWDDIPRRWDKTWKSYRKTQWFRENKNRRNF